MPWVARYKNRFGLGYGKPTVRRVDRERVKKMGHADLPQRPLSKKAASGPLFCCIAAKPESTTLISNAPQFGRLEEESPVQTTCEQRRTDEVDSETNERR